MSRMGKVGVTLTLVGFIALLADCGLFPERTTTAPATFSEVPPAVLGLPLSGGWGSVSAAHIPSEASAAYGMYIYYINPNLGPLPGGTPVVITGSFPVPTPLTSVGAAAAAYTVYFDYEIIATFDGLVPQVVTATAMYVIAPLGIVAGPGDVLIRDNFDSNILVNVADGYTYQFLLFEVLPNSGPEAGGNPVTIFGTFGSTTLTTLMAADDAYDVFFGTEPADFDDPAFLGSFVTATEMHVVVPPSVTGLGPVNVTVVDLRNPGIEFTLIDGYTYFQQIVLTSVAPIIGPLPGAQMVTLTGTFPVVAAVMTAYTAYQQYIVYFAYGNRAPFDELVPPVITEWLPPAENTMKVLSPPGPAPGLVDVWVIDANDVNNFGLLLLGYEYEGGLAAWTDVVITPNPVGPVDTDELTVVLTITGTVEDVFILPQGGDPLDPLDRIEMHNPSGDEVTWTNENPISTVVRDRDGDGSVSFGDLFADGHAAVILIANGMDRIGDSAGDPTDGGIILSPAIENRHFLIDTVAPTMIVVPGSDTADVFVTQLSNVNGGYRPADIVIGPDHPFPLPGGFTQTLTDAPFGAGTITGVPGTGNGAQIFMNMASEANNFVDETMDFRVQVVFEDLTVHETFGFAINALTDTDFFDNTVLNRQVSGFDIRPSPDGDFPGGSLIIPEGGTPDSTIRNRAVESDHVQWVFAGGSDIPPLNTIGNMPLVDHQVDLIDLLKRDTGFWASDLTHMFNETFTRLDTIWEVGDAFGTDIGIRLTTARNLHMILQFRARDWAGSWPVNQTNFTEKARRLDPLHIWWLRDTATRLFPNREGSEVFDPTFTLRLDNGFSTSAIGLPPIYNYRVFVRNVPGKGAYDLPVLGTDLYEGLAGWTGWGPASAIPSGTFISPPPPPPSVFENRWILLVAVNTDEAGNVEKWPDDLILDVTENDIREVNAGSGRNWQRFFIKAQEQQIETELTAFFWHNEFPPNNDTVDAGERTYGDTHVIPLPPRNTFSPNDPTDPVYSERVEGRFVIDTEAEGAGAIVVSWGLFEAGSTVALASNLTESVDPVSGQAIVTFPTLNFTLPIAQDELLGDRDRRRAISYVFRATTVAGGVPDSTPANFHFTVVPSVQGFIENRQSDDEQPIKVFERQ